MLPRHRREIFEKTIERVARLDVVEQGLDRNPGAGENRVPPRRAGDEVIKGWGRLMAEFYSFWAAIRSLAPAGQVRQDGGMSATSSSAYRPRLYLIDGTSNVFRAFFAIRNLSTSKGEPTNAVFGFLQMLRKLLKDEEPDHIGIAFDVSADTHRKDKYEDYKANRRPMPDDLRPQLPLIRQVVEAFNIPILEMPKYEADDVLGTLAKRGRSRASR